MTRSNMNSENIGADRVDHFERKRISLLRKLEDPGSIRRLNDIGVGRGWRCLEVGAGDGSLARWLAEQVGLEGQVVATDIDLRFLKGQERENLEIHKHDILEDRLAWSGFDLVHARTLLMHLSHPDFAIRRMVKALKPGGWLYLEDTDFMSFKAFEGEPRLIRKFNQTIDTILNVLSTNGVVDPFFGRQLPGLIESLNPVEIRQKGTTRIVTGDDPAARYHKMNFCDLVRPSMAGEDGIEDGDFQPLERVFSDPSFSFIDRTMFAVWARVSPESALNQQ